MKFSPLICTLQKKKNNAKASKETGTQTKPIPRNHEHSDDFEDLHISNNSYSITWDITNYTQYSYISEKNIDLHSLEK